jgi:dipeptidyl aminopeptidase/acylaminoacyl peptidase
MGKLFFALRALACFCAAAAAPLAATAAEPPPLDAYGDLPAFEAAAISRSGEHVAIVGTIKGERQLLLLDSGMKLIRQSSVGDLKVRGVEWIGDEATLLTYSETEDLGPMDFTADKYERFRGLIVPLDQTAKTKMLFSGNSTIVTSIRGSYGIRRVAGEWEGYFGAIKLANSLDAGRYLATTNQTLFAVRLRDNDVDKLADPADDPFFRDWLIDADGNIAATFDIARNSGDWRIENGKGDVLVRGTNPAGNVGLVSLGKDGTTLIYSVRDADGETNRWFELPLAGGSTPTEVFEGINIDAIFIERSNGRLIGYRDGDNRRFFDPAIQQMSDKIDRAFRGRHIELADWTPDFGHALVRTSGSTDSGTWYLVDLEALKAAAIGVERPLVPASQVGAISSFRYKAADGLEMDGVLTLPPGRAPRNLPVVVLPHGGPAQHDEVEFDWWAQAFASRGYAVFQPNFRGSTGRSAAFRRAGDGQWGRKMQTDISDGLAALVAAGTVDPKRACIMGASYGGYAALAGVTLQHGLYRCAVGVAPVSDLVQLYDSEYDESGKSKVVRTSLIEELGPRAELPQVSPRRFAAQADAPILLIHGKDDTVVPYEQSTRMADALKDAHKDVRLVELSEEDHWLSRATTRKQMLSVAMAFVLENNPPD